MEMSLRDLVGHKRQTTPLAGVPPGGWWFAEQAETRGWGLLGDHELGAFRHAHDGRLLRVVARGLAALVAGAAELEGARGTGPLDVGQRVADGGAVLGQVTTELD